ncbi:MAG: hypothetical protein HY674_19740 [Chloroflexi bacterium]|nr:hypothetical protein [Chloroflexota bacterium]
MDWSNETARPPWQPLTFGGVARFAQTTWTRLLAMKLAMAVLAAAIIVWFLAGAWIPAVRQTIRQLPAPSGIRDGKLQWPGTAPVRLAEGKYLSILVNPGQGMDMGQTADLQWEFRGEELRFRSFFGYVSVPYPKGWIIALNRSELEPWWGAWEPAVLAGAGVLAAGSLLLGWSVLATVYLWLVLVVAWLADRQANRATAWKLGSAAQMPGAALMSGAILLYGLGQLPLVGLLVVGLLHIAVGWVYLLLSPLRLPRLSVSVSLSQNPFQATKAEPDAESHKPAEEA